MQCDYCDELMTKYASYSLILKKLISTIKLMVTLGINMIFKCLWTGMTMTNRWKYFLYGKCTCSTFLEQQLLPFCYCCSSAVLAAAAMGTKCGKWMWHRLVCYNSSSLCLRMKEAALRKWGRTEKRWRDGRWRAQHQQVCCILKGRHRPHTTVLSFPELLIQSHDCCWLIIAAVCNQTVKTSPITTNNMEEKLGQPLTTGQDQPFDATCQLREIVTWLHTHNSHRPFTCSY